MNKEARLTEGEINAACLAGIKAWVEDMTKFWDSDQASDIPHPKSDEYYVRRAIADAAAAKMLGWVIEWGDMVCPHAPDYWPEKLRIRRGCVACWQSLKKETP